MEIVKVLWAPLVGALIGYCTNYIAVKMLFRPYKAIKIGKWTLPFTPGIIPKRQPDLARAVGHAVADSLLGGEEIEKILLSDKMKQTVTTGTSQMIEEICKDKSLGQTAQDFMGQEAFEPKKGELTQYVTSRITEGIMELHVGELIASRGAQAVSQMGGLVAMFASESMINSLAEPIGKKVEEYILGDGQVRIYDMVEKEVNGICEKPMEQILSEDSRTVIVQKMGQTYEELMKKNIREIVNAFDVSGIIEEKINAMDVRELEQLILSVMKNELGMIVNLGAVIGFVLGLINLLFR